MFSRPGGRAHILARRINSSIVFRASAPLVHIFPGPTHCRRASSEPTKDLHDFEIRPYGQNQPQNQGKRNPEEDDKELRHLAATTGPMHAKYSQLYTGGIEKLTEDRYEAMKEMMKKSGNRSPSEVNEKMVKYEGWTEKLAYALTAATATGMVYVFWSWFKPRTGSEKKGFGARESFLD